MNRSAKLAVLVVALAGAAASLYAQNSLTDNASYKKSLDLQRSAKAAYDSGDYLKAKADAAEADKLASQAREEAEVQLQKWTANSWLQRAKARIASAEKLGASGRYPDLWQTAVNFYGAAQADYAADRWKDCVANSKGVIDTLAGVQPAVAAAPTPAPAPAAAPAPDAKVLPAFYIVQLKESARDCFWRISAYPFVYGDPLKWRALYEANKDKIPSAGNPDLMLPGTVLAIPSIAGEKREGTWKK